MNKKIIVLICLMLLIILTYFIFITKVVSIEKPKVQDLKNNNEIIESKLPSSSSSKESNKTIDVSTIKNNETITYNNNGSDRTATLPVLNIIERTARKDIANFDFLAAENSITSSIADYDINNSPDFDELKNMYFDLPIMIQFEHLKSYGDNKQVMHLIKGLKDSENYFVSVMWLDRKEREDFIYMSDSINPVFSGGLEILKKDRIVDLNIKALEGLNKRFSDIEYVDEIEFEVEENTLIAYIVKTKEDFIFFRMIEKVEDSTTYYTIKEWNELYEEIKGNLNPNKTLNVEDDISINNYLDDEKIEEVKEDD